MLGTLIRLVALRRPVDDWLAWPALEPLAALWRFGSPNVPWEQPGQIAQVLRDWRVQAGWFAGVAPERLARWYEPPGRRRPPRRFSSLRRPE